MRKSYSRYGLRKRRPGEETKAYQRRKASPYDPQPQPAPAAPAEPGKLLALAAPAVPPVPEPRRAPGPGLQLSFLPMSQAA